MAAGWNVIDITGEKYGRLNVIERAPNNKQGQCMWKCKCECGNEVIVRGCSLRSGITVSCGCYHAEVVRSKRKYSVIATSHGRKTRLYRIWGAMKQRCYNPNNKAYKNYGGRGIAICDEWKNSYENFSKWAYEHGYSDDLSIDRIDNDGIYEPKNCRWATKVEQNNNTRRNKRKVV